MSERRFPFRLGPLSRPILLIFGARQGNSYVDINGDLRAHFGLFGVSTPVENIRRWRIEGPWNWLTAIGVRRGIRNGDITFGGNHRAGVRLDFKTPIKFLWMRPPTLYVTVDDLEGFAAVLSERGIPGEDVRAA